MVDTKISELPSASAPLIGTELGVLVQSGTTKKILLSDLLTVTKVVNVTSNYTLLADDSVIITDGTFTLQLPAGTAGKQYQIKNINSGTITILPDGAETIDGYPDVIISNVNTSFGLTFANGKWLIF
jgi:hypothetical protein